MAIYLPNEKVLVAYDEVTGVETMANAFTYGANMIDHANGFQGAYLSTDGELIQLGGMIRNKVALPVGGILIKLASVLAPVANEMVQIEVNGVSRAAEVDINGEIVTLEAIGINGTISLNSIRFLNKEVFAANEIPAEQPMVYYPTIQSGKSYIMPVANTVTSARVTFDEVFEEVPNVVLTAATTQPGVQVQGLGVANVTVDGFSIYILRTGAVNTNIHWIATTQNV